jgi:hypothetical protein
MTLLELPASVSRIARSVFTHRFPEVKFPCEGHNPLHLRRFERSHQEIIGAEIQHFRPECFVRQAVHNDQLRPIRQPIQIVKNVSPIVTVWQLRAREYYSAKAFLDGRGQSAETLHNFHVPVRDFEYPLQARLIFR